MSLPSSRGLSPYLPSEPLDEFTESFLDAELEAQFGEDEFQYDEDDQLKKCLFVLLIHQRDVHRVVHARGQLFRQCLQYFLVQAFLRCNVLSWCGFDVIAFCVVWF